ncbi:conserved Plasmodium protein, unknown function [Plasmodium relictum]|uniref:Uncharacterized protein n=1 Tax=Plasmodium relictum TaxID=85471 RepID=A0A1J1HBL8_PLARL|nr:conserved Plasmodium protein, unknown function [Plasmodium relictum]CRH02695.1 conserved Plasmodium protein, unknown function [Plasmodium relictum]
MIDLQKFILKKTFKFYRNINKNLALFYINLLFHNFNDDLILVLIKTYNNILNKYKKKKVDFYDEYFMIFNYVIFSYFNFFSSELDLNNSLLFDIFHDFNIKCLKNGKKKKKKFPVNLYYNKKKPKNENRIINYSISYEKNVNNLIERENHQKLRKEDKYINGVLKKNNYYNENYCPYRNTCLKYSDYHENSIYDYRNILQHRQNNDYNKNTSDRDESTYYINREMETFSLKEKLLEKNIFHLSEEIYLKKKNLIKELKNLYAHVYYWKYLIELQVKCNRKSDIDEKNIYIDIYKNIYNLFKRMNEKNCENLEILNEKKEELSITHNNEMENIINENKINKKNGDYQQKINNMVYKHIAEKKALDRHIEHELNIMQQINLKEYKENIFYIFNIIGNNENILSLPPLPIEEKEKEKKLIRSQTNEIENTREFFENDKDYKCIIKSFNFSYLYKLIKSRINIYNYLNFQVKNSLYDVLNISIIFSLGEPFNIFEQGNKNNIEFKKKFLKTLSNTYNIYYVYNYENKIYEKGSSSINMKNDKNNLSKRNCSKDKLDIFNNDKKKNINIKKKDIQIIIKEEEQNNTTYPKYQDSKYFDEKGNFKNRNLKEEKNFFNMSYCSTYKFLKENSVRFLKKKILNTKYTNINTSKLCIKDKKLNALIIYINEDFNYHKENVYKNLLNISITKTDFIFPNLKEQLNIFNDFKNITSYNYLLNMKNKNKIKNFDENKFFRINENCSYFSLGNIIITRHMNLNIAMNEISNKKKNKINMNEKNGNKKNIDNSKYKIKTENNFNLSRINNNIPQIPISEKFRKNDNNSMENKVFNSNINYENKCEFYKKFLKKKKKKNIHIDIIFHVIIPKNINRKSFKIILFSLFKILDLCKMYNIYSLNFSLPYVHNIVYKSKRPAIYSFIYSFIFSVLEYIKKSSESSSNSIKIFHFIFPHLKFYENKYYTKNKYNDNKKSNNLTSYNFSNTSNLKVEKNNLDNIIEYKMNEKKKSYKKISNVTTFIDKIIVSLKERYILIESI